MIRFLFLTTTAALLAGCLGTGSTPGEASAKAAKAIEIVARWEQEGLIDVVDLSEKRLRRLVLACDSAEFLAAGDPNAEAIVSRHAAICDILRDAWAESQKPTENAPEEAPIPVPVPDTLA